MSYEKREKIRRKRMIFRTVIMSFILIYLVFRAVPSLLANNAKTVLPEKGTLIEKIPAQGFMIKSETVVKSTRDGELDFIAPEGERLGAGAEVVSINSLNDTSSLRQELMQIEESIAALERSEKENKILDNEKEKIEEVQETLVDELQNTIISGNFNNVYLLKGKISLYDEKNKDISFSNTLAGQSLESLKTKRDNINAEIKSNHGKYYTSQGGIISYIIDGYEEIYLPKDFENYTYDKLISKELKNISPKSGVSVGEPIYKIVDNFEWYMAIKVEDLKQIQDFEVGNTIRVEMKEDKLELKGRIIAINPLDNKGVMVIRFNTMLHNIYNNRFSKVDVIKYTKDGYKIPTKAIVDKDSTKGVYIKDKSGIVKFRPVIIIGEDNNYTYIDIGDNNGNILLKDQAVKTVTLFDEIFLNTINIKEGQILNQQGGIKISIQSNIISIQENIENALKRSGREGEEVQLIAVTKTVDIDKIQEAISSGITDIGENRVQELEKKYDLIGDNINYHMIGHLQTNKVRNIIGKTKLVHSLDRISLAEELNKRSKMNNITTEVLIQVNVAEEESKFGLNVNEVICFIEEVLEFENINIRGLMTIAPNTTDKILLRKVFRTLSDLKQDIINRNYNNLSMDYLSAGMSNDYELAIEEGANIIRVGSGIFGKRNYQEGYNE